MSVLTLLFLQQCSENESSFMLHSSPLSSPNHKSIANFAIDFMLHCLGAAREGAKARRARIRDPAWGPRRRCNARQQRAQARLSRRAAAREGAKARRARIRDPARGREYDLLEEARRHRCACAEQPRHAGAASSCRQTSRRAQAQRIRWARPGAAWKWASPAQLRVNLVASASARCDA